MSGWLSRLAVYFSYPFVRYALIVSVLVGLCAALLGVTLVLKRFSYIGDGLSHVAFGAMAAASLLHLADATVLILPVTVLCAVLLLKTGQSARVRGDAVIAMVSVGALALGYLLMNVFSVSSNVSGDVCSTLFGSASILTLTQRDVAVSVVLSAVVLALFLLFYHRIFAVTFDEAYARATGLPADRYHLLIAVIIAVIIVMGMQLVGSLLISALVIFPAISAMRLFSGFRAVTVCSGVLSVIGSVTGLVLSVLAATPIGATIVAVDILILLICSAIGAVRRR